jgi:hypothetical protein
LKGVRRRSPRPLGGRRAQIWLSTLARRHLGLAPGTADHVASAAAVCLARFHEVPPTKVRVSADGLQREYDLVWRYPTAAEQASNRNHEEATRDGAYALALGAADVHMRMRTIGRAESRTGSDWYLRPEASLDQMFDLDAEDVMRFEVSGISDDSDAIVRERVRRKVDQIRAGRSPHLGIVGVVGFRSPRVVMRRVDYV